uniref:Uncharacterized protein n=1 Tax=Cacopsylla melanoneura TaxID=428564 RepID=A0A8D8VYS3_9HEMI
MTPTHKLHIQTEVGILTITSLFTTHTTHLCLNTLQVLELNPTHLNPMPLITRLKYLSSLNTKATTTTLQSTDLQFHPTTNLISPSSRPIQICITSRLPKS